MYANSAQVNDLGIVTIPLDEPNGFALCPDAISKALSADSSIKVVYITTPGNPTGNLIARSDVEQVLEHPTWSGVVVIDEAYIDFAPENSSLAECVTEWPNLIVIQTISKAFGLAGVRLGATFSSPEITQLLNNLKAPYNISTLTNALACRALQFDCIAIMKRNRREMWIQRDRLLAELPKIAGVGRFLGGCNANFLLVQLLNKSAAEGGVPDNRVAMAVSEALATEKGVVLRFRGKEPGCFGSVRVTVGTEKETDAFLKAIKTVLAKVHALAPKWQGQGTKQDKREMVEASSRSRRRHAVGETELTSENESNPQ